MDEQAKRRKRMAEQERYAAEVRQRSGRSVDRSLGRRRVDETLLVDRPNPSTVWWEAQTRVWEEEYVRRRLREHLATAARVIALAEAAEADARRAAMVAASAAVAAAETSMQAAAVPAAAQPVAVLMAPVASAAVAAAETAMQATAVPAAAQPVAVLMEPVLLREAEAEAPPVELPAAWWEWPLPPPLTLQLMEEWLAPGIGCLRLSQVCHALAFKDGHAGDLRKAWKEAAAREDAARQWAAIRATQVEQLLAGFWPKGASYQPQPSPPPSPPPPTPTPTLTPSNP